MGDLRSGGRPREAPSASRPATPPLPSRTAVKKPRPDPGPLRIAFALTGMATASALITAILAPSAGANAGTTTVTSATTPTGPSAPVRHDIRYVQLKPGETAPPEAVVKQAPAPKPRVVVITTRQSGK